MRVRWKISSLYKLRDESANCRNILLGQGDICLENISNDFKLIS